MVDSFRFKTGLVFLQIQLEKRPTSVTKFFKLYLNYWGTEGNYSKALSPEKKEPGQPLRQFSLGKFRSFVVPFAFRINQMV